MRCKGSGPVLIFFMRIFFFILDAFLHIVLCFSQLNFYLNILKYSKFSSFFPAVSIKMKNWKILNSPKYLKKLSRKSGNPALVFSLLWYSLSFFRDSAYLHTLANYNSRSNTTSRFFYKPHVNYNSRYKYSASLYS